MQKSKINNTQYQTPLSQISPSQISLSQIPVLTERADITQKDLSFKFEIINDFISLPENKNENGHLINCSCKKCQPLKARGHRDSM
jgi:hypothetical protein